MTEDLRSLVGQYVRFQEVGGLEAYLYIVAFGEPRCTREACAKLAIKSVTEARQRKEDVDALAGKLREKDAKKKRKEATI